VLRAVKNRFGSTNEIGVFEMTSAGLAQVGNPSEIFLAERPVGVAGSVVVATVEGSRPLLVEVQALVTRSSFGYPTRRAEGFDSNRLSLLIAVLEKRMGLALETSDVFVNVAGGISLEDPAADLGVLMAIASAFLDRPVQSDTLLLGEVGLTGEIRSIAQPLVRINEAEKLGFHRCLLPKNSMRGLNAGGTMKLSGITNLQQAFDACFRK
jgi:DNA repair protein RadA/Sms